LLATSGSRRIKFHQTGQSEQSSEPVTTIQRMSQHGQSLSIGDALRKISTSEGLDKEELRKLIEAAELNEKRLRENEGKMAKLQTKLQRLERNGVSSVNCPQRPKDMMGQHRSMGCLELTSS
jgi:hypothetical protein